MTRISKAKIIDVPGYFRNLNLKKISLFSRTSILQNSSRCWHKLFHEGKIWRSRDSRSNFPASAAHR